MQPPDGGAARAVTLHEICDIFAPFAHKNLLLAVSGGPDSVAMMGMAAHWRNHVHPSGRLHVATVDHGLRIESRVEAEHVAALAATLGFSHDCLCWDGPKPKTRIQEAARAARYRLLTGLARDRNAVLLTAHTADDQAETILFRLLRGSGPSGLAGMQHEVSHEGVAHVRPLLHLAKARLVATCRAQNWPFIEDPSNVNPLYARARMRRLLPLLAEEGLTIDSLTRLGTRMAKADRVVETALDALWPEIVRIKTPDYLELDLRPLTDKPVLLVERAVQRALDVLEPGQVQRLERIERFAAQLCAALKAGVSFRRSLGHFIVSFNGAFTVKMEPASLRRRGLKRN